MKLRVIGDIHGDLEWYKSAIKGQSRSLQLGDFGIGFVPINDLLVLDEEEPSHLLIRGNHDDPTVASMLNRHVNSGDTAYGGFCVGGAWSIDRHRRTAGLNWWAGEEHTHDELDSLVEQYKSKKPELVFTHDCPTSIAYQLFLSGREDWQRLTKTGEALQTMFEYHQPKRWYFGHWHTDLTRVVLGCEFTCIGINSYRDIEV